MADSEAPSGPNLETEGIPLSDLAGRRLAVGSYQGNRVVLVSEGGTVFALDGSCSHYGAPLEEGLFDGECIRCPWHHSRFEVATGRPFAPAYKSLTRYATEVRDGSIFVTGTIAENASASLVAGAAPESVVIVGGGAAGHYAAETLRAEGYSGPITILSADGEPPYDRPNVSKDYLAGSAQPDWMPLREPDFYREHQISVRTGARVAVLDTSAREVVLDSGERIGYGALLLATGAEPVRLPLPGMDLPHVFTLRSMADSDAITAGLGDGASVAIVGASFIGMESAAALRQRGMAVTVIAPESQPLELILGPEMGARLRKLHEEHGVQFRLGRKPTEFRAGSVLLDDGSTVEASVVVVGVGVRPRIDLAKEAGIATENGVTVDEHLAASVLGVWAAGDIAAWPDTHTGERLRVEHWTVAQRQGGTAARNILGIDTPYREVPFFWSQQYDLVVTYVGSGRGWDAVQVSGSLDDNDALVAYRKAGRIIAVAAIFRDVDSLKAEVAMERGDDAALEALLR